MPIENTRGMWFKNLVSNVRCSLVERMPSHKKIFHRFCKTQRFLKHFEENETIQFVIGSPTFPTKFLVYERLDPEHSKDSVLEYVRKLSLIHI